ncbi:MAG: hypothetical protein Roseis2KO_53050 [Roseivirga sp.]
MSLTKDQLKEIQEFIHSRGFNTIEVEMEILDHVACAVEDKLNEQPELTTSNAVAAVHTSFGVMGFSVFEDDLQKSISRKIRGVFSQKIWSQLTSFNLLKVLALSACIFALLTCWRNILDPSLFKVAAFITIALFSAIPHIYHRKVFSRWRKKSLIMGRLLWPFTYAAFSITYLIQLLPVQHIVNDIELFNTIILGLSFVTSLAVLSTIQVVQEMYIWTQERWLKYHT